MLHLWAQLMSYQVIFWCSGLAWAICEHLVEVIKAPTLFATHFHELTALARETPNHEPHEKQTVGVANYHVSAHIDSASRKLTMLYKVDACSKNIWLFTVLFSHVIMNATIVGQLTSL